MSYQPVPDVEHGGSRVAPAEGLIARAKETYPEVGTDIEAEFLGRLDDAIENCRPIVSIPRLQVAQLEDVNADEAKTLQGFSEFAKSLNYPAMTLVMTLSSAFAVTETHNPLARAAYPYFACLLTFASSVPIIRQRFLDSISPVFKKFTSMQRNIERQVEGVAETGMLYLDLTESSMNRALSPISQKLASITKLETALRRIDPKIDIPDTSDIEKLFDEYQGKLKSALDGTQHLVDLIAVYHLKMNDHATMQRVEVVTEGTTGALGALMGVGNNSSGIVSGGLLAETMPLLVNSTNGSPVIADNEQEASQWHLMWIALHAYVATVAQVSVAFLLTQARAIVAMANRFIAETERNVNGQLKIAVGGAFEDIFEKGFGRVKVKFLKLVRRMDKLEETVHTMTGGLASLQIGGGGSGSKFLGLMGFDK